MIADELTALIRQIIVEEMIKSYRGIVVSQDPSTFACVVNVPGMPLVTAPWFVSTKFTVTPGAMCVLQFDQLGQAMLVAVNDAQATLSPAVLGDLFLAFFNLHVHASNGAPPTAPMTVAQLSTSEKVRP